MIAVRAIMAAVAGGFAGGVCAADVAVVWRSSLDLPVTAVNQSGQPTSIGALSGIARLGDGRFAAVSDTWGTLALLSVGIASDGALMGVTATAVSIPGAAGPGDYEDVAWSPTDPGVVYMIDEGPYNLLYRVDLVTGAASAGPSRPAVYGGARADCGLNALTFSGDGTEMWLCNQEALTSDGARATMSGGTRVRLQRFTRSGGTYIAGAQYAYITEPVYGATANNAQSRSGVVALTALPGGGLLVTEQSFSYTNGVFRTRMYLAGLAGASDTSSFATLPPAGTWAWAGKDPVHAGNYYNLEGLCLGPRLANGDYVLLGVVDDHDAVSLSRLQSFVVSGLENGCGAGDVGQQGAVAGPDGLLDNNDFVVFIGWFFGLDSRADMGRQGGLAGADGVFDNNDFVVFIEAFFTGCG